MEYLKTSKVSFRMVDLCRLTERYLSEEEVKKVYEAFLYAAVAHEGVTRKSGEPYISHPLEVAHTLADLHLDVDTLCAALLHDVIEDTDYTHNDIANEFGDTVADLVEGVTKLSYENFSNKYDAGMASFQKMMTAMVDDYRVVIIKLADRLHNVKTLSSMRPVKQRRIAQETLEIHVPLARRMGMNTLRHSLQMFAFQSLHPWRSSILSRWWQKCLDEQQDNHEKIMSKIQTSLNKELDKNSTVFHWEKNLYRLYEDRKQHKNPIHFSRDAISYDIRILTQSSQQCYLALGVIHNLFLPKIGSFKDFISVPKVYGFQALQTTVITKNQNLICIQIQSREMFQVAQYGIAAQWRFPQLDYKNKFNLAQSRLSAWLEQVKEIQQYTGDPEAFLADMKADFFLREVSVLTPKGEAKALRIGATPVDFAYAIHTDIGHHCTGAYIDGRRKPLNTQLHDGATVKIITNPNAIPHPSWQNFVVTGKARSAIRSWLTSYENSEYIEIGERLFKNTLNNVEKKLEDIAPEIIDTLLETLEITNIQQLFIEIAKGNQCSKLITHRLLETDNIESTNRTEQAFYIRGAKGLAVQLSTCCHPIPDDTITAAIIDNRGLAVHRNDCSILRHIHHKKQLTAAWDTSETLSYLVPLALRAQHQQGVLFEITQQFQQADIDIEDINIFGDKGSKRIEVLIRVTHTKELKKLVAKLNKLAHVSDATRIPQLSSPQVIT
ncbi:MAG: bifunctional (p)ppGpp synthetase/guanosine-3',5'-bis(diphosphate) 3'-pyrophosphohydrolase [Thiotrichaceae bacterium]|nr:bifunctional (p)ppGpp synthetase/guanosine-3',5'-bis(diphosphate) 3'-pyrophosphohydrolase [Thiotrichaceae bacterium]